MDRKSQKSEVRSQESGVRMVLFCILASVFCVLSLAGCQQAPPPPQSPAASQAKKEAPKLSAAPSAAEVKEEPKKETAADVKQKNPFKPFITTKAPEKAAAVVAKTPLQKYELEQLKLVAVMWGMNGSFAMVEAPDGKGYSVKKGDLVGNRDGRVKRIEKNRVIVEERFTEAGGEVTTSEFEIKLPLSKGEEELR